MLLYDIGSVSVELQFFVATASEIWLSTKLAGEGMHPSLKDSFG